MNILILSAGRRVELVKEFKKAKEKLKIEGKIITADLSELAPATFFGDKNYKVPRVLDEKYIDSIIEIANLENVKLIIPTIDTELLNLAKNKKRIEEMTGAIVLISNEEVIKICRDKINTSKFLKENNFKIPKEIDKEDLKNENYEFPLFIKPVDGSSSINTFKILNKKELEFFNDYIKKPIVQEFISGTEYTVDVFLDFDSKPITVVPRERKATRGGEISIGRIVKNEKVIYEVKRLVKVLKPIGAITVQCMENERGIEFIEINPRFGGGAPMSIKAGANSPEYLYRLLRGEVLEFKEDINYGITGLRFDDSIYIDSEGNII